MKYYAIPSIIIVSSILIFSSCKKEQDNIIVTSVNKQFVLIRNVDELQSSSDPISMHIDSILQGLIDTQIISTGMQRFDLTGDGNPDISFEILDLMTYNQGNLPENFDSLAAKAWLFGVEILDNSTWGYPDALTEGIDINNNGNWRSDFGVLGTFLNAGQFQGQGDRYLAFRIPEAGDFQYGWIKLYCSQHSDTLRIIEFAYNTLPGGKIQSGQTE
jgi:hypothetical protein